MSRLTRTQLDLTTKTLLPAHVATAAVDALPPDPLQTNYEYAGEPGFNAGELHALHEVGRRDRGQRPRQARQRHRLRGQRQLDRLPADRGQEVRRRAPFAARCPTRSSRATPTSSPTSVSAGGPARRRRRSGRRHADLAELRLPRRGADRRSPVLLRRRSGCRASPTRWPTRRPRRSACRRRRRTRHARRRRRSRRRRSTSARDARGARQADAVLHRVAGGEGARRVHHRAQRVPRVHAGASPPRWSTRRRRS